MKTSNTVYKLPLKNGGVALLDDKFVYNKVKDMKWKFWKGKGVVSYDGKQAILLHNMISSFSRVSFLNNDKKDCRKCNLVGYMKNYKPTPKKGKYIYDDTAKKEFRFHRNVRSNGRMYNYSKSFVYTNKSKKEALRQAEKFKEEFNKTVSQHELLKIIKNKKCQGKMIYEYKGKYHDCLQVRRSVRIDGVNYHFSKNISYRDFSREEVKIIANKIRDHIASMSPHEFAKWAENRPRWRPTTNEVIQGWDCWNNHEANYRELAEMGISSFYELTD